MPRYDFRCQHGTAEVVRSMNDAGNPVECEYGCTMERVFTAPHFQEDRTRFWRNKEGGRYSSALGDELPESKAEIRALAKSKGIELTDTAELPHLARTVEIGRAIREGVKFRPGEIAAHIAEPKEKGETLLQTAKRLGKMQAISERVAVGYENWIDRGAGGPDALARDAERAGVGISKLRTTPIDTVHDTSSKITVATK